MTDWGVTLPLSRSHRGGPRSLRERISSIPALGPLAVKLARVARTLSQLRLDRQVGGLFGDQGVRTAAGGLSHARFVQFTELTHTVNLRIFDILEEHGLPYVLDGGHLVGHQRDGRVPLWAEDADIRVFPEAFELFEDRCIPALKDAGFDVLATTDWQPERPLAGYAILGLSRTSSHNELRLTESEVIRSPRSQLDVFFSRVDEHGFVRNAGGWWGRWQKADIPVDVVLPSSEIEVHGRRYPSYRDPKEGVRLEFGEVERVVRVYSHFTEHPHRIFLTPSWETFRRRLDEVIDRTTVPTLPGGPESPQPVRATGLVLTPDEDAPLSEIFRALSTEQYDTIVLSGMLALWVLDLKHWFPGLRVLFRSTSEEHAALGLQLSHLLDGILADEQ